MGVEVGTGIADRGFPVTRVGVVAFLERARDGWARRVPVRRDGGLAGLVEVIRP